MLYCLDVTPFCFFQIFLSPCSHFQVRAHATCDSGPDGSWGGLVSSGDLEPGQDGQGEGKQSILIKELELACVF